MTTDYTGLITSEHNQQPDFDAVVNLTANGVAQITSVIQSLPGLFDLNNAVGAQLDVVGQWVGISRLVTGVLLVQFFGFADDSSALGFGELGSPATGGRFIELGESPTGNATLGDPEFRLILSAKIVANQYDGNIADYDAALADVLPGQTVLTFDPGQYVLMIVPQAMIDPIIQSLLTNYDLLPRPGGVRYQYAFLLTPLSWTTAGTATGSGSTVQKNTGVTAWDSSAYIASPFNHVYMSWTVPDSTHVMVGGLATNPSGSPNFPTVNFGITTVGGGTAHVIESGTIQNTFTYAGGDTMAVYHDGRQAVYLHNGKFVKTTPSTPGSISPMFALNTVGASATNIFVATG